MVNSNSCSALTRDGPGAVDFAVLPGQEGGRVCLLLQLEEVLRGPGVVTSAGTPHEFVHPVEVCGLNLPATERRKVVTQRDTIVCAHFYFAVCPLARSPALGARSQRRGETWHKLTHPDSRSLKLRGTRSRNWIASWFLMFLKQHLNILQRVVLFLIVMLLN